jgi:hypothetical protein
MRSGRSGAYRQIPAFQLGLPPAELGGRAREHDRALAEHEHLIADRERHPRVLLHEQDRHALALEPHHQRLQLPHEARRESLGRLVQHEELRVAGERARDGEHLLLAAREAPALLPPPRAQDGEVLEDPLERPARAVTARALGEAQILPTSRCGKICRPSGT